MHTTSVVSLLLVCAAAPAQVPTAAQIRDAAQLFDRSCASCHSVPDPTIRTDLAWIDQVNRTS